MRHYGIDYSLGGANFDTDTAPTGRHPDAIHFGVIPINSLTEWIHESLEADYGEPHCPKCGNEAVDSGSDLPEHEQDYCLVCEHNHGNRFRGGKEAVVRDARCHDCDCREPDWAEDRDHYESGPGACGDYACDSCKYLFDSDEAFGDEPQGFTLDEDGIQGESSDGIDLFILKSPYYTHAQFCSPCAPGACYLSSPVDTGGPRAYCLPHDYFEGKKAPYPVFRIADGTLVKPEAK